jgi:K+-sensing histidine kinase KdpD
MYKYALLVLKNELERLKKEQQECVDRCSGGSNNLDDLGTKLFSINTYQSSIFDLEDAIGILEDIAKDVEKDIEKEKRE